MVESVYVHIPFCKQKCLYCDFNSFKGKENLIDSYMEALYKECARFSFDRLKTIYIGGGTPSFIDSKYIVRLLTILPKAEEVTIEMNPCTVIREKLEDYKTAGVTRISMGLQTTNDSILKEIGRVHTLEDFEKAYMLIKDVGFENINADLMFGLPNQTLEDVKNSLDYLIEKNPTHISCYSLILHNDIFKNLPSVVLTTFALVTAVTLFLPVLRAYSNAERAILSLPSVVVTQKSKAISSSICTPLLPSAYEPSVFSR